MEANGVYQLFGFQHSSKYLVLCSAEERKYTGLKQLDAEKITDFFYIWVNYTFKSAF